MAQKLEIGCLRHYPMDGRHLEVALDGFPFMVAKGIDEFWYGEDAEKKSRPHLWYAFADDEWSMRIKGFKTPEKAVTYALGEWIKYNKRQIKKAEEKLAEIEEDDE